MNDIKQTLERNTTGLKSNPDTRLNLDCLFHSILQAGFNHDHSMLVFPLSTAHS